jgi:elongation factor P
MIKAGQIEKGTALLIKGQPFVCVEREFVNPGKGSAFVRLKLKSPSTGQTLSETMKTRTTPKILPSKTSTISTCTTTAKIST